MPRKICVLCNKGIKPVKVRSVAPGTAGFQHLTLFDPLIAARCEEDSEICNACYMVLARNTNSIRTITGVPVQDTLTPCPETLQQSTNDPRPGPSHASLPFDFTQLSGPFDSWQEHSSSQNTTPQSLINTPTTPTYRRPSCLTERRCFLCGSENGRTRVPAAAIRQALTHLNIIIPPGTRCCISHLVPETGLFCADGLYTTTTNTVHAEQELVEKVQSMSVSRPIDRFNFFDGLRPHDYDVYFGQTIEQMREIFQSLPSSPDLERAHVAFAMLLVYKRLGVAQDTVASMFKTWQSTVSENIAAARDAMINHFVPRFLGYQHMTRQQYIQNHSTTFSHRLTNSSPDVAICILDGTYLYCQKSANFGMQKKTYSMHKFRNLIKPMMIIGPDGYILEVEGMYPARDNDADITKHFMERPGGFRTFFQPNDVVIVDRGFRDAVMVLEGYGLGVDQPEFLHGASQFTTQEANDSRLITKIRWPVEADNGFMKQRYKLFQHVVSNHHLIGDRIDNYFRIACALKNAYHKPAYTQKPEDLEIANYMLQRAQAGNDMKDQIEAMGLDIAEARGRWSGWRKYTSDMVTDFPRLNMDDLRQITIGIYQLKMAASYAGLHFGSNDAYIVWLNNDFYSDLLRVKMQSRHKSNTAYLLWINYVPGGAGPDAIKAWYCKCPVGSRVVGTCSHVASVLWFLCYARHLNNLQFPAANVGNALLDARNFDYYH